MKDYSDERTKVPGNIIGSATRLHVRDHGYLREEVRAVEVLLSGMDQTLTVLVSVVFGAIEALSAASF